VPAAAAEETRERFLSPARTAGLAFFVLFGLTFARPRIFSDGILYHNFVRRLVGDDGVTQAYQFGSAFWAAPFYLASKLVAARGQFDAEHAAEIGNLLAAVAAGVVVLYLGWRILRELDLPRGPAALLLALFGTPLWWYVFLEPSWKQAADTLYMTAAVWFLLRVWKEPRRLDLAAAAGACFGFMLVTRYANVAMAVGAVVALWPLRAWRTLGVMAATAAVTVAILCAVPVVAGIPFDPPPSPLPWRIAADLDAPLPLQSQATRRVAASVLGDQVFGVPGTESVDVDPLAPVKMLFTPERGLFLWTPLTAFACVGFALLIRRDRRHRSFLLGLAAGAVALLAIHALWGANWAGGSYSARFLTALFPLYLLGTAELLRRRRWPVMGVLSVCVVWSVWIGLVILNGYRGMNGRDGVSEILHNYVGRDRPYPHDSFGNFAHEIHVRIDDRWRILWGTVS